MTTAEKAFRKVEMTNGQIDEELVYESGIGWGMGMNLVRKQYPTLLATNVVSVQPLSQPVGLAYAMRFAYDMNKEYRSANIGHFDLTDNYSINVTLEKRDDADKYNFFKSWIGTK